MALELRTQFHIDAMTATQTAGNAATRELLARVEGLLSESGIPLAIQAPISLNHLGQVLHAQAQTQGFQDGFMLIAIVFFIALIPAYILSQARER